MATIQGVWTFKERAPFTAPAQTITQAVNFTTADGTARTEMEIKDSGDTYPILLNFDGWTVAIYNGETEFRWVGPFANDEEGNRAFKIVDFGKTEQTVSDEFYSYLTQIAVQDVTVADKLTRIAYNERWVYDAGYTKGVSESYDTGYASGYADGGQLFKGVVEGTLSGDIVDNTITALRQNAFLGFENITSLTLNKLRYVNPNNSGTYKGMTSLETLNLPLATNIGYGCCVGCSSLKNVYAPNAGIGYNAFGDCTSLEITDFPKCSYVNAYTYNGCNNLKIVILRHNGVAPLNNVTAFNNTPFRNGEGGTVYVPQAHVERYKIATNWNALESTTFLPIEGSEYE